LVRPMMASFKKNCVNFVQNWPKQNQSLSFCGARLWLYIYYTIIFV
jgi:hypothetical protein